MSEQTYDERAAELEALADAAEAEEPEGYGICCTKARGEGHDDNCPWLAWYINQWPARQELTKRGYDVQNVWGGVEAEGIRAARQQAASWRALGLAVRALATAHKRVDREAKWPGDSVVAEIKTALQALTTLREEQE